MNQRIRSIVITVAMTTLAIPVSAIGAGAGRSTMQQSPVQSRAAVTTRAQPSRTGRPAINPQSAEPTPTTQPAQPGVLSVDTNTLLEITRLDTQARVLKAQLKIAELKLQIKKAQGTDKLVAHRKSRNRTLNGFGAHTPFAAALRRSFRPVVLMVSGFSGNLHATLSVNGGIITVKQGDPIPGGKILSIHEDSVIALIRGKAVQLIWNSPETNRETTPRPEVGGYQRSFTPTGMLNPPTIQATP